MTTISEFKTALDQANTALAIREAEIKLLHEKIRFLQFRHFGKSSERLGTTDQDLFPELADAIVVQDDAAGETSETVEVKAHKKAKGGRKKLPAELPRREVRVDLTSRRTSLQIRRFSAHRF
jgi:hypothetical protein